MLCKVDLNPIIFKCDYQHVYFTITRNNNIFGFSALYILPITSLEEIYRRILLPGVSLGISMQSLKQMNSMDLIVPPKLQGRNSTIGLIPNISFIFVLWEITTLRVMVEDVQL